VPDPIRIEPLAHLRTNVLHSIVRAHARQRVRHHVLTQLLLKVTFRTPLKRLKLTPTSDLERRNSINTLSVHSSTISMKPTLRPMPMVGIVGEMSKWTRSRGRVALRTPGRPDQDWCILAWIHAVQNFAAFRSNFEPYASFRATPTKTDVTYTSMHNSRKAQIPHKCVHLGPVPVRVHIEAKWGHE
jgi:hypothetical protein